MLNAEIETRRKAAMSRGVGVMTQIYADRAENAEIWDKEGNRYIDFASGIAVLNTGHRHPKVIAAVKDQIDHFTHTCHQVVPYENYVRLAERLNGMVPGRGEKKSIFVTTGAEAVENAVKIARVATGRPAVVVFDGAFHGRTLLAMTMTSKVKPYKAGFGPFAPEVYRAPAPYPYHGISSDDAIAALEHLFKADVDPSTVSCVVIEPVQGEGGFVEMPADYLLRLQEICRSHGILFVDDEVQSGVGRTGTMWAVEQHEGVEPDMVVFGKSIGGGLPLAGVTGRAEVMDAVPPGGLGGTFGGNPVSCAAGIAVLDVLTAPGFLDGATKLGETLRARLDTLAESRPEIGDVRGLGAMLAFEFAERTPDRAQAVVSAAAERGLLLLSCGLYGNVIRLLPPLNISAEDLDEGLAILEQSLGA